MTVTEDEGGAATVGVSIREEVKRQWTLTAEVLGLITLLGGLAPVVLFAPPYVIYFKAFDVEFQRLGLAPVDLFARALPQVLPLAMLFATLWAALLLIERARQWTAPLLGAAAIAAVVVARTDAVNRFMSQDGVDLGRSIDRGVGEASRSLWFPQILIVLIAVLIAFGLPRVFNVSLLITAIAGLAVLMAAQTIFSMVAIRVYADAIRSGAARPTVPFLVAAPGAPQVQLVPLKADPLLLCRYESAVVRLLFPGDGRAFMYVTTYPTKREDPQLRGTIEIRAEDYGYRPVALLQEGRPQEVEPAPLCAAR